MSRTLETLSPREVLALAIHVEQANARRFRAFAEMFETYDPAVARKFVELAEEEDRHEKQLWERFLLRFGGSLPAVEDVDVPGVVEAVDLDDAEHLIFGTLEPRQVYELALLAEYGALAFYRQAVLRTQDQALAALYRELGEMEDGHVSFLEEKLRNPL